MLYHITSSAAWHHRPDSAVYTAPSLSSEGFIHSSYRNQVAATAGRIFRGRTDLVVLCIDEARLSSPVVVEDTTGSGTEFPHIYGPVNADAITAVIPFPLEADGAFGLPPGLPS